MKKQHFIFLGKAGLIYYSWMFIVLFVSLINFYEQNTKISWVGVIFLVLFFVILVYTFLTSYWQKQQFKLPFKAKTKIKTPVLIKKLWRFNIYEVTINDYQKYYLLRFNSKRS